AEPGLRQALRPLRRAPPGRAGVRDGPPRGDKPAGEASPLAPRPGGALRAGGRRHGAGQRVQRAQRPARPAPALRAAGAAQGRRRRGGAAPRRGLPHGPRVRHAAHRRPRPRHRQAGDAARRRAEHQGRDPVPSAAPPDVTPTVPDWVKDAVFYQVFPDRFARSERLPKPANLEPWGSPPTVHGYKGGDLLGVLDRLEALGVNAIYLNPVFASTANHRYHTADYHAVDPLLGGDRALAELLDGAHARGMRVILDGVFNHSGRGFLPFADVLENGEKSPYLDWFHVRRLPLNAYGGGELGYEAWWGLPALPKLNVANPLVREFVFELGERWLRFGADGWRLDVPSEIDDDEFWREFRRRCVGAKGDAYIVGEIWELAERWVQGDMFHGV